MQHLPPDFEQMLSNCIAPGEQAAVAAVIEEAALAGDQRLAEFLDAVAARLDRHPAGLRGEELRALLRASG